MIDNFIISYSMGYNFRFSNKYVQIYVVQQISAFLMSSSFFFKEEDSQENLQYDNTAFLHFAIAVCCITTIIFTSLIYRDIVKKRIPHLKKIQKMKTFEVKLKNTLKIKKSYVKTFEFGYKLAIIILSIFFAIFCYSQISQDSKMIGFDPNQILGVPLDADVITIKKAYRKLALLYHPDRNINNPEIAAKFIQISKAYECLTDEQAKEKCKKYGNPDGTNSFKVGIGLPRFMVQVGNQYFILIPIFIFLLVIVPRAFINWSNRIKPMDTNGNLFVNYGTYHALINPNINPIIFSVLFALLKQLDSVFTEKKTLDEQTAAGLKSLLVACRATTQENVNKIDPHLLYRIMCVYNYMADRERDIKISEQIPELCPKIMMFTLFYAQKIFHGQPLQGNPHWIRQFLGIYPVKLSSFFSKQMYNPSIRLGDTRSIEFLDLTAEEDLMAKNIPIGNLHQNLLWDNEKINSLVLNFAEDRQAYVRQQIQCLTALKVECRVLLGQDPVQSMTISDFATIEVKIKRKKQTLGYVVSKDFPFLVQETYILIISYNQNMIFFSPVVFKKGQLEAVYKCPHRQNFPMLMKFDVSVMSNNYPNMDIETSFQLQVVNTIENRRVQIHHDDLNLERMPKTFFESLASMDALNEEERQLSEGSDDEQEKKMKQEPMPGQGSRRKACCDDDHDDHDHRPSFREQPQQARTQQQPTRGFREEPEQCCDHQH